MERFIFDIDGTLLFNDFSDENYYFREILNPNDAEKFIKIKYNLLMEYELNFFKYNIRDLSRFLTTKSMIDITEKMILGWIDINAKMKDEINEDAIEVLEYLNHKRKSVVILTNWFAKTQIQRLKNAKLYEYFENIYCGDQYLKPNPISYMNASGEYEYNECIMIGDNYLKDVVNPKLLGMEALFYNKNDEIKKEATTIKSLRKIKEMY